jgi:predicted aspartyl protease
MERFCVRFGALMFALCTAQSVPARPDAAAPVPPTRETIASEFDRAMRMTVPVTISANGSTTGPYQFIVDTGADRTVVSRELADRLDLPNGQTATLHSLTGVRDIRTVVVPTLGLAGRTTENINAPALSQANLGASGLLGIDSLKGRRIIMDFKRKTLTIAAPGERERFDPDMIVVTAKSRFGQLVLVDASVDGVPITVVIDTGAENTIGNSALRAMLAKRQRSLDFFPALLTDVTGGTLPAEVAAAKRIKIGDITLDNVVIAFTDAHPFKKFGLQKKPAMLLGMDTLRGFSRVSVDFGTRTVRFLLPDEV